MWQQFAEFRAAVAVRAKLPRTGKQLAAGLIGAVEFEVAAGVILHVMLGQFRFRIEQINVAWPTLHEHRDHCVSTRFAVWLFLLQVKCRPFESRLRRSGGNSVTFHQPSQRQ